jgi:CopG antitoxin of type II toxin-antitoxin system
MNKPSKVMPKFKTEVEERAFWEKNDSLDYFDLSKAVRVTMPNLKPGEHEVQATSK